MAGTWETTIWIFYLNWCAPNILWGPYISYWYTHFNFTLPVTISQLNVRNTNPVLAAATSHSLGATTYTTLDSWIKTSSFFRKSSTVSAQKFLWCSISTSPSNLAITSFCSALRSWRESHLTFGPHNIVDPWYLILVILISSATTKTSLLIYHYSLGVGFSAFTKP